MAYTFVLAHPVGCPSASGWWLRFNPAAEKALVDALHYRVTYNAFVESQVDPHIQKFVQDGTRIGPVERGARWLVSALKFAFRGTTILVNAVGGMCPARGMVIISEQEKTKLEWPSALEYERIYIQQWELGMHFYLQSSVNRILDQVKYETIEESKAAALNYVPANRITVKEAEKIPRPKLSGD